jgi:oligopeptide transport system substrate-binding protein
MKPKFVNLFRTIGIKSPSHEMQNPLYGWEQIQSSENGRNMKTHNRIQTFWLLPLAIAMVFQVACNAPKPEKINRPAQKETVQQEPDQEKEKQQSVRINISSDPRSLDPARAGDLQSMTLVKMLFDGLTYVTKENRVEMALAENVIISEDQKTYTFTLRDAQWSNGDAILASDFIYAWRRVVDPNFPAENAFYLHCIKNAKAIKSGELPVDELGVKVINEKTLQIDLESPTPYFLELLSYPVFCPINENIDKMTPNWVSEVGMFVGNGPFTLSEWIHRDSLTLQKNPTYWDKEAVHLDEISMYMVTEETELSMFENKEIDWAGSPLSILPLDALGKLEGEKVLNKKPILGTYFLRVNTENGIFRSQKIRQALSLCLNREELVEYALFGSQVPATGYVPEVFGLHEQSYFKGDHSHEAMKSFEKGLEELNMTKAEVPELEILLTNNERNLRIAQLLQERWQRVLGLKVRLNGMEAKSYFEKLYHGEFQLAAGSWLADYNDPISFLEIFKSKEARANQTRWENETYSQLIEASNIEADARIRKKMLAECEQILIKDMPIIPLFHYNLLFVKSQNLSDVFISNLGVVDFRWAKMEK